MINKKTKIVATIGPASETGKIMKGLIKNGVNVFRFNTKHADIEWHNQRIRKVQKIAEELKRDIGIMIDLQGKELRIETREEKAIKIKKGSQITIGDSFFSKHISIVIPEKTIFKKILIGDKILIDDGFIELEIIEKHENCLVALVKEGGEIKHRKSINFPGTKIKLSSLIEKDIKNLDAAAKNHVDFISLSFVDSKKDIQILRREMKKRNINASVVSKIESQSAIENIDEIIEESDAIMIARGDLGVEIPIESLAYWQKEIIQKCRERRKPVIVATQMLYSMIKSSRPTRAEATDIANAVFDGTDAVMLSEETASGRNPIKAVSEMVKILRFNEEKVNLPEIEGKYFNPVEFIISAIAKRIKEIKALKKLKIKTIIVFSESGYTAKVLSAFRLKANTIVVLNDRQIAEKLSLSYGVIPYFAPNEFGNLRLSKEIINDLKSKEIISRGETIAIFHGSYNKEPSLLNLFSLNKVF